MYQELALTDFLLVAYRPDLRLLVGRWQRSVSEAELREGYETMRRAARTHGCQHWLMDARRRIDRCLNGPEWVVTQFLPRLQREMGGLLCVAFLVLPNHLREIEADPSTAEKVPDSHDLFHYARFIDEGVANAWLDKKLGH